VGIWTPSPAYSLDVTGDVRITGNLLVDGASTTVSSSHLSVEDHQILLAVNSDSTQDDVYADYGGIIVKGTTEHSMLWKNASTAWVMSENLDITEASSGARAYRINGVNVLEYTGSVYRLSAAVTSAPGITSFGTQTELTVDNLYFNSNRIQSLNTGGDIEIEPNGAGNVALIGSPKITGLADPTSSTDAVNKQSMEAYVRARNFAFSMDITGLTNTDIESQLNQIAPHEYYEINTEARIHCTTQVVSYTNVTFTSTTSPVTTGDFVKSYISVDNSGNVGTKPNEAVLQDFNINPINLGNATVTVTRINKLFRLVSDSTSSRWQFITNF
jgi:hypothetical protein